MEADAREVGIRRVMPKDKAQMLITAAHQILA